MPYIQEPFTRAGTGGVSLFKDSVQEPLKLRADLELDEVMRTQGIISGWPMHFPHCTQRCSPGTTTLVGPLVNLGGLCESWAPQGQPEAEPWQAALAEVRARQRDLKVFSDNAPSGPAAKNVALTLMTQRDMFEKRIEAVSVDFVAAALRALGFPREEADSVAALLASAQETKK